MYYVVDKDVIEKDTQQVVNSYDSVKEANEGCRKLNLGAGFQGLTPAFFCWKPLTKKRGAKIRS